MIWGMLKDQGMGPMLVSTFSLYPGHLSDGVAFSNPNPWPMSVSWEAPGSPFGAPSLSTVGAFATATATASHSGSGGDASTDTDANNWSLPNGVSGSFSVTYEYTTS